MIFSALTKTTEKFVIDNSPVILTGVGVVGTITTAVLSGKAGAKIQRDITWSKQRRFFNDYPNQSFPQDEELEVDTKKLILESWRTWTPPVATGALAVASTVMAQHINMRRAAGLAAAYVIAEKNFGAYKDKVAEQFGIKGKDAVETELAKDAVDNTFNQNTQIIITGNGNVLLMDAESGRYFRSTIEKVQAAVNLVNYEIIHNTYSTLTDFYDQIGLEPTSYSDEVGWNSGAMLDVDFKAATTKETNEPCLVMTYVVSPTRGYLSLK